MHTPPPPVLARLPLPLPTRQTRRTRPTKLLHAAGAAAVATAPATRHATAGHWPSDGGGRRPRQPPPAATDSATGTGTLSVTIDGNGDYHFSSDQPIVVTKISDLGVGVPNAPVTAEVSLNDIHDFE